mmetsp:Transcript_11944/g.24426  ORF Transcript_11944/g.24426 Transcript_11944/m.24426 type:complete len:123 (+) Transcript_11944:245-613(+)
MPHWPSKTVSTRLIKYIKSINLAYNPFHPNPTNPRHVRGIREFETRINIDRFKKSNPALKITSDVHNRVWEGEGGTVHVTYADSSTLNLTKFQGKAEEIEEEVFRKAEDVEWEYEQEGKTIE